MRNAVKSIVKYVLCFALIGVIVCATFFGLNYYAKTSRNINTLGKTQTEFYSNAQGNRIQNIPFSEYVLSEPAPSGAVIPDIKETANGEYNARIINEAVEGLDAGGSIYIPSGEYRVSTIYLKSDVTLFIPTGARLVSLNYDQNKASPTPLAGAVIIVKDARNVVICGGGTISGEGESYTLDPEETAPLYALEEFNLYTRVIESRKRIRFSKDTERNNLIELDNAQNVTVKNIVLEESAEWTLVVNNSSNVNIHNIVIDNNFRVANSDGIDICGSSDVHISDSFIATGDDAIVLKSRAQEIRNVTVDNCMLSSFANCFKIGTETAFDVTNVSVSNSKFFLPDGMTGGYAGIAIESADGACISDVEIQNITMDGISSPLLIWLGNRLSYAKNTVGSIQDITISDVYATNTELPSAITGCKINGKTYSVQNVTLNNITHIYRDTAENLSVRQDVGDGSMDGYPEITRVSHVYLISHELSAYWDLPCYALFIRYAQNINYTTYRATPRSMSSLPPFVYK